MIDFMKGGMPIERGTNVQKSALKPVAATTPPMHSGQDCGTIPRVTHLWYHIPVLVASLLL